MKKQAGLLDGVLNTVKDKVDFKNKPFETIFGAIGPVVLWRYSKLLGVFVGFLGEALGFGPGRIGRYIDEHLLSTKKDGQVDLSSSNLQGAATSAIDNILGEAVFASGDLFHLKKEASLNDLIAFAYLNKYALGKEPVAGKKHPGFLSKVLSGQRVGLINIIWGLLKTFAIGMAGVGIVGGLLSAVRGPQNQSQSQTPAQEKQEENRQRYTNVNKNVEDTLITFLDAAITDFSKHFEKITGNRLKGSQQMKPILNQIANINGASLQDVDGSRVFVAPKVLDIAQQLLPQAKFEKIQDRAKPEAPVQKVPQKTIKPKADNERLKQLLKEVYHNG